MARVICNRSGFCKIFNSIYRDPLHALPAVLYVDVPSRSYKHYNPKFKWHRTQKVKKIELPDYHKKEKDELTPEEIRTKMKEKGVKPPRFWDDRPMFVASTGGIFEAYIPPEGDGKVSVISKQGAKQRAELIEKKSKSMLAIRKIKAYDEDFETEEFCKEAEEIYKKAHEALMRHDPQDLVLYATERGLPEMLNNVKNKTLKWQFIKTIEPTRIVHARYTDVITKTNLFAQVTVRFHSQQILAIYDRFGRLMHGSEILAKDVLEYIVFEKHLSNVYGKWRLHDKVVPDWMALPEPPPKTYRADIEPPMQEEPETATSDIVPAPSATSSPTPAIAA